MTRYEKTRDDPATHEDTEDLVMESTSRALEGYSDYLEDYEIMTVAELIEKLKECPQDMTVMLSDDCVKSMSATG